MGSVQIEQRIVRALPIQKISLFFAGVESRKKLENAPVFVEQAEMEAI